MEKKCKNCEWFHIEKPSSEDAIIPDYGRCWRFPSTVVKKVWYNCGEYTPASKSA